MKKTVCFILSVLLLSGCGKSTSGNTFTVPEAMNELPEPKVTETVLPEETPPAEPETEKPVTAADAADELDVDIVGLPGNLIYAQVYNIVSEPDAYLGQNMRICGQYTFFHDDVTGNDYHAVLIADAAACCAQGIEFVLREGYSYPSEGDDVIVTGVFDTYLEGDQKYCTLREAVLE